MKLDTYFKTLRGAVAENKLGRYALLALCLSNVVLAAALFAKTETVVLVPPTLSAESRLSENQASASLKEAWATFVVMQMASVTPRTADYVGTQVGKFIAPIAYVSFMQSVAEQTQRIKDDNITVQFTPTHVFYVDEADTVVVSGEYTVRGMRDNQQKTLRTYEVGVRVSNYQVRIDSLVAYDGPWKPAREEEERNRQREERRAAQQSARG